MVFILLLLFIKYFTLYSDITDDPRKYNLKEHGVCIFKNILDKNEINTILGKCNNEDYKATKQSLLNNSKLKQSMYECTGPDYVFQDYIWIIKKSSVHTCHRDNNGDFFNKGQKYPSYTMLVYLEDMNKCLGVIPKSHIDRNSHSINLSDPVVNMVCNKGDVIIFNANLIHVGTLNDEKNDHLRIQMKITHKEDLGTISYYQNFNKVLNEDNTLPLYMRKAQKKITCMFPALSNLTQKENIRTARGSSDGVDIGIPQQIFSYLFYGNSKFYDLPNAF